MKLKLCPTQKPKKLKNLQYNCKKKLSGDQTKKSNSDKSPRLKLQPKSITQIVTILNNLNCDNCQKINF